MAGIRVLYSDPPFHRDKDMQNAWASGHSNMAGSRELSHIRP